MAALAAAVHPLSASPPPARRVVARRTARTRLAAAAADAVICVFLASMWILFGSLAAMEVGRLAWGEGCPVFVAASKVLVAAMFTFALVLLFGVVPLMTRAAGPAPAPAAADDIETAKDQAPTPKSFAAAAWGALRDPVMLAFLSSMPFLLLVIAGAVLKDSSPVKGSLRERTGSVIYAVGALGLYTVDFLVACPILTVSMWRAWRRMA
ncbi:unnamed protein product [Urochloa decumbens]|uniref:Uncharacterized protein n=1 Tax=Urochloa decumbens TaxID=240449 RepID=A0ABC9C2Y0_9POAL